MFDVSQAERAAQIGLRGADHLGASVLHRVAAIPSLSLAEVDGAVRLRASTGVILARLQIGAYAEALELAERIAELMPASVGAFLSPLECSVMWSAVAEAFVTSGQAREGATFSYRAAQAAEAAESEEALFRAHSLVCVCSALFGDYAAATDAAATARAIARRSGWSPDVSGFPLILGEILIHSAELDPDRLSALASALRTFPSNPRYAAAATAVDSMVALVNGDPGAAVTIATNVVASTRDERVLPMIRGFATGILADALLTRGEPDRALTVLDQIPSPAGHALCFDMQRASAYLMREDYAAVLRVTSGCVSLGTEHSLRTLTPILLRRALAHLALGDQRIADIEVEDALRMMTESGSATPLLTLSITQLQTLLTKFAARNEAWESLVSSLSNRLKKLPQPSGLRVRALPLLTPRETELAWQMREDLTLDQIARERFVSRNTVKSQVRSLYVKLGVSSRQSAVQLLERGGFYERQPPRRN